LQIVITLLSTFDVQFEPYINLKEKKELKSKIMIYELKTLEKHHLKQKGI